MNLTTPMFLLAAVLVCGCESKPTTSSSSATAKMADTTQADNTKKNERDVKTDTKTPGDQGESETDRTITQDVRKSVMGADGLSMDAKNVKIVTKDGTVTLRGPVSNADEKNKIAEITQKTSGVKSVDNQLEVKTN